MIKEYAEAIPPGLFVVLYNGKIATPSRIDLIEGTRIWMPPTLTKGDYERRQRSFRY
jgi:hypothetical protein